MAAVSRNIQKDAQELYTGLDDPKAMQDVGLGLVNPNIYATPEYQDKKIKTLIIGGLVDIVYAGFDVDPTPLIVTFGFETAYNTVLGMNLHYVPQQIRQAILKYIYDSNAARIRANQPLMINWQGLRRVVPEVQYITRRYKQVGIGVVETYPLVEWPEVVKQPSRFENHFREKRTS